MSTAGLGPYPYDDDDELVQFARRHGVVMVGSLLVFPSDAVRDEWHRRFGAELDAADALHRIAARARAAPPVVPAWDPRDEDPETRGWWE